MLRLTTRRLLYHCDHLSFLPRSLCLSLPLSFSIPPASTLSHIALTIVPLSIYISLSLVPLSFLSPSFFRPLPLPPPPPLDHPFSLALVHLSFLYLSFCLSYPLCSSFSSWSMPRTVLSPSRSRLHRTGGEHRPILHLNLVNLPELANELRAWCLILAHEHGRRYTMSNASGEDTCVQSSAKIVHDRETQFPRVISS